MTFTVYVFSGFGAYRRRQRASAQKYSPPDITNSSSLPLICIFWIVPPFKSPAFKPSIRSLIEQLLV